MVFLCVFVMFVEDSLWDGIQVLRLCLDSIRVLLSI